MPQERYYGLDALRGIMMMLGIVLHAATYHLLEAGIGGKDISMPIILILSVIHQFRMPLFFVLAGFFAAMMVAKYTMYGLYQNRLRRILGPFLLGLVTIVPLTNWVFFSIPLSVEKGSLTMVGSMAQIDDIVAKSDGAMPVFMSFMHLWFLYYLMIFYLAAPALEKAVAWMKQDERNPVLNGFISNPWTLGIFSLITMATLLPMGGAIVAVNDKPFLVNPWTLLYYFVFFAAGYIFFHFRDVLQTFREHAGICGVVAFLTFVWFAVTSSMLAAGSESLAVKVVGSVFAGVSTWAFIYFLSGLFLNRFNEDKPRTRFLSQSSYWIYLFHMPVVLLFGILLTDLPAGPIVTFVLNCFLTSVVCIYSYIWFVRGSWIGQLLNGRRFTREGKVLEKTSVQAEHA